MNCCAVVEDCVCHPDRCCWAFVPWRAQPKIGANLEGFWRRGLDCQGPLRGRPAIRNPQRDCPTCSPRTTPGFDGGSPCDGRDNHGSAVALRLAVPALRSLGRWRPPGWEWAIGSSSGGATGAPCDTWAQFLVRPEIGLAWNGTRCPEGSTTAQPPGCACSPVGDRAPRPPWSALSSWRRR